MGCWGITAFESDAGLDAAGFVRCCLPEDGRLELGKIIEAMQKDEWNAPPDVTDACSHTGPMALAEILTKFLDGDIGDLDYDEEWAADDNKFSSVVSFTADRESIRWLRDYISDTLKSARENAEYWAKRGEDTSVSYRKEWGGWRDEKKWQGWQDHMSALAGRMDTLLASAEDTVELIRPPEQACGADMAQA